MNKNAKWTIAVLLIVILAGALLFVLVVKPQVNKYITTKQIEAQQITVMAIMQTVQQQGYVALNIANQSMVLVEYRE